MTFCVQTADVSVFLVLENYSATSPTTQLFSFFGWFYYIIHFFSFPPILSLLFLFVNRVLCFLFSFVTLFSLLCFVFLIKSSKDVFSEVYFMENERFVPDVFKVLGKNIKKIRMAENVSQEQLAEKINKSPHLVGLFERGKCRH